MLFDVQMADFKSFLSGRDLWALVKTFFYIRKSTFAHFYIIILQE